MPSFFLLRAVLTLVVLALVASTARATDETLYQTLDWEDLIPASARQEVVSGLVDHGTLTYDPAAQKGAPLVPELNGKAIRLAGFVVPLEGDEQGVTEFLLVPYMGACVHVPPPPSNQIVYVRTQAPLAFDLIYDALWVAGTIKAEPVQSELAEVGYQLDAHTFEVYQYQ